MEQALDCAQSTFPVQFWVLPVILTSILKHSQFLAAFIFKDFDEFFQNHTALTSISLQTPKISNLTMLDSCKEVKLHSSTKSDVLSSVPLEVLGHDGTKSSSTRHFG